MAGGFRGPHIAALNARFLILLTCSSLLPSLGLLFHLFLYYLFYSEISHVL